MAERILPEQERRHDHQKDAEDAAKAIVLHIARDHAAGQAADDAERAEERDELPVQLQMERR